MVWRLGREPVIVQALGSKVESWSIISPNEISIQLRDSSIRNVIVRSLPVMMGFEPKTEIIGLIDIISEDEMSERYRKLYQELKCLEFETESTGLLTKKLIFKPYFEIQKLQKFITDLKPKDDLINALEQDPTLIDLIYKARPHEMYAALQSLKPADLKSIRSEEEFLRRKADFFRDPSKITWIVTVAKMLISRGFLGHKKTYIGLVSLLDHVSIIIIEVTRGIQKEYEQKIKIT